MTESIPVSELPTFLNRLTSSLETPSAQPAFKQWLEEFVGQIGQGFQSSESQFDQAWAPLRNPRPKGHNQGSRPLIDTGDLMLSVISEGATGNIFQMGDDFLRWGTNLPGATAHQDSQRSWLPKRPFLNVNQDQAARAAELVAQRIIKALSAAA